MANDPNTTNAGFAEASMSVPELNNYVSWCSLDLPLDYIR
jgi:hypothetical protein